jgi:uncharacterized protein YkwD
MSSIFRSGTPLVALLLLAMAGCPLSTGNDGLSSFATDPGSFNTSADSGLGDGGGAATGTDIGPPESNDPADDAEPTANVSGTGTAVAGATSSGSPDALSARFLGCNAAVEELVWVNEVLRLVNVERARVGTAPVVWNDTLAQQAEQYACEMVSYNFFDHVDPITGSTLRDRAREFSYDYWIIGENLAAGQRSPAEVVAAWMNSPCHRENVMNPAFTELGIGVRVGGTYGYYWVQEFGRPFDGPAYPGQPYRDPECTHSE